jgi:hypothetical protein
MSADIKDIKNWDHVNVQAIYLDEERRMHGITRADLVTANARADSAELQLRKALNTVTEVVAERNALREAILTARERLYTVATRPGWSSDDAIDIGFALAVLGNALAPPKTDTES